MVQTAQGESASPRLVRTAAIGIFTLLAIVLAFAAIRVIVDGPNIRAGTVPTTSSPSGTSLTPGWATCT